jgi:poly-gamma-glutamate synthesis protein (capsule biosynthesis protein)
MDRNFEGIEGTVSAMKKYGLDYIGICDKEEDAERIFVKEINGIKVGFLNYTYGTNAFYHHMFLGDKKWAVRMLQPEETLDGAMELLKPNEGIAEDYTRVYVTEKEKYEKITEPFFARIEKEIAELKKVSDFVVAMIHSGGQYNDEPDLFTIEINKRILAAGADILVGNHPHIIQRSEFVGGKFCAYSLGNFIYMHERDRGYEVDPRFSALLDVELENQGGRVEISKLSFKICHTKGEGSEKACDFIVCEGDEFPKVVDSYEEYLAKPSEELKQEILYFANRFIGKEGYYTEVSAEYVIPKQ